MATNRREKSTKSVGRKISPKGLRYASFEDAIGKKAFKELNEKFSRNIKFSPKLDYRF